LENKNNRDFDQKKIGRKYVDERTEGKENAGIQGRRAPLWAGRVLLPERSDRVLLLLFVGSPTFCFRYWGKMNFNVVAFIQSHIWAHTNPVVVTNVRLFFQHEES